MLVADILDGCVLGLEIMEQNDLPLIIRKKILKIEIEEIFLDRYEFPRKIRDSGDNRKIRGETWNFERRDQKGKGYKTIDSDLVESIITNSSYFLHRISTEKLRNMLGDI